MTIKACDEPLTIIQQSHMIHENSNYLLLELYFFYIDMKCSLGADLSEMKVAQALAMHIQLHQSDVLHGLGQEDFG